MVALIPLCFSQQGRHTLTDAMVLHGETVITQSCVECRHGGRARCEEAELRQKGVRHISAKGLDMSGDGTDVEQHIVVQGMESWKHEKWKALHVFWEQRAHLKNDLKKTICSKRASLRKKVKAFSNKSVAEKQKDFDFASSDAGLTLEEYWDGYAVKKAQTKR